MHRVTDPQECRKVTDKYPRYFTFNVEAWLSDPANYALQEGENIAFGEYKSPGVYWVHFCFHTARGREAIQLTEAFFIKFCQLFPVKTVIGLIETDNKKAKWLVRQSGFQSLGEVETKIGPCEMFYRTKGKV